MCPARLLLCSMSSAFLLVVGCESEVGQPCDANTKEVLSKVEVKAGKNDLVRDVSFDNCSQALCASIDGGRPFCTKECEADSECGEAGPGFTCQEIIRFGALACIDYTPLDECDGDGNGDGYPCDCFDKEGLPSKKLRKYCTAPPDVLDARDEQYGRPAFSNDDA